MVGRTVSHYRILDRLGGGGMGVVYKAEDTRLKRLVALKFLPPALSTDPHALERFEREAQAASALNHPHICTIHDIDEHEGRRFIAMELLEGQTLKERFQGRPLPTAEIVDLGLQLADALEAAHAKGIVHRDVKPANIFVTTRGAAKLLDFGVAKLAAEPQAASEASTAAAEWVTGAGAALGTIGYMSPEQVRGDAPDARTDLFSLGVVLYEMATGTAPFRGATSGAVLGEVLTKAPTTPMRLNPDVPPDLEHIVNKLLEKDRALRYQSARDLRVDLERLHRTLSSPAAARQEQASIVVLPFDNLSPDPEQEYFCDGMTEEIIADLSKVRALRVISRTSAMRLKGTDRTLESIARELKVRHVLEGSVRKAGNNLRITAQLIDATSDAHVWAEKYTGTLDDVFEMQEKVSRAIVAALRMTLTPDEERKIAEHPLVNRSAYDAYLRARQDFWRWSKPALDRARTYLQSALDMVGDNVLLHVGLGHVYAAYAESTLDEPTIQQAEACARRALHLEPDSAEAQTLLASIAMLRGRIKDEFTCAKQALSLNPNDPDGLFFLGTSAFLLGRMEHARSAAETLLRIDPLWPMAHLVMVLVGLNDEGPAGPAVLSSSEAAYRLDPTNYLARYWYAVALAARRRFEEAQVTLDHWLDEAPGHVMAVGGRFLLNALRGARAEAMACLTDEFTDLAWKGYWIAVTIAEGLALVGERAESLRWLERAIEKGWANYPFLSRIDPWLEAVRDDPRFETLMARVKREWEAFEG
jgi:serine/threonine protein kinase/cytochrome c-type biogenesis protein CcmH/NrfG